MKSRKKILILLVGIISIFGLSNVKADTKKIEIKDITVKEKSGTITVVDPIINENEITSNITFNEVDDFVTFDVTLKNNEDEKYKIDSIVDNNTNNNIKIDYTFSKDFINKGETTKVAIKLTYKNKLLNVDKISLNDLTIKINLVKEDGSSEEIIINPVTGDNIFHYLVLLIIALTGLILIIAKKNIFKLKIGNLLIVLAFLLIPFVTFASEKYEVQVKFTNLDIIGEFETYNITINPNNGTTPVVKNVTYGDKIGTLPANPTKDGYTFNKWVDEEGNEVTIDTVITKQISVIASYNLVTYNITYDLDEGSLPSGKSNPDKYTIESQSITLNNPTKQGYTFAGWSGTGIDGQTTEVTIDHGSIGDRSYKAHYLAKDDTKYTVIHKFQKLTEGYDEETVEEHGTTGSTVPAPRKTRTGFITPAVQNVTIEADESASVTYVYDRETYAFSITDRTYVDSTSTADGTYPYGTSITVKAVNRPGYDFAWSDGNTNLERTFTLENEKELTPEYTAKTNTPYVVNHYKMNLDGENYTKVEDDTQNLTGTTDSPISPAVNTYEGFTSPQVQSTTINGDGSTVVNYYYTRNQVTVTFTNTEYIEEDVTSGLHYYGEQITLTAKTRDGYTFTGWTNGETSNPLTITVGTSDISVGPEYTAKTNTPYVVNHYKMNLDGENYTKVEDDTQNLTGTTDATITPAVNTYDGFTSPSTQTTTISGKGDTVVNYYYTRNKYTLTINHPEYLEEDKSGDYYYEEEITLTAIDRQGYTFAGWNTGETTKTITVSMPVDGITEEATYTSNTDTTYSVTHKYKKLTEGYDEVVIGGTGTTGDTIEAPLRPQTGFVNPTVQNITITADGQASVTYIYDRETYAFSITDRTYLDSTSTANGTYPYETEITLKAQERTGYTFKWSDDVTDLERTFELAEATTLSLIYTADTYTLTADANEGTIEETTGWTRTGATATKTITYDSTYGTLPTVKRTGYTFTGWTSVISGIEANISEDTTVFTTTDQTITANWSINSYTVSFDVDGGSEVPSQTVSYGSTATRPATDPTKTGYTFDDWYTTDQYTTKFDFTTPITGDTTIYAHFVDSCNGFDTASWSTIKTNIENDSDYYPIGCQKEVEMDIDEDGVDESYTVRLANTSTPEVCSTEGYSQTACGTVIEFVDIAGTYVWNVANTAAGGWKNSAIASYLNSDFYNKLPSDLKAVMKPTYPIVSGSCNDNNSPDITVEDTNLNKLYLLSAREVGYDLSTDNKKNVLTDTRTLDYYEINSGEKDKQKQLDGTNETWWLRTPSKNALAICNSIYNSGTSGEDYCRKEHGIAPAFRIGTVAPSKYTVSFNSEGGSTVDDIEVDAGDSINELPTPTKTDSVFVGWFESVTDETPVTEPYTPSGDITLIAKWNNIICKKATDLHEVTCAHTDGSKGCRKNHSQENYTYGNIIDSDTFESGDVLDCDVDGTGYNQRFYYMRTIDDKAVLISYTDFEGDSGQGNTQSYKYATALTKLPTTTQWDNLPVTFESGTQAARLMTYDDLKYACGNGSAVTDSDLVNCEYIFENSGYESTTTGRNGTWIAESGGTYRRFQNAQVVIETPTKGANSENTVKPVIEVPLRLIEDAYIVKFNTNGGDSTTEYVKVVKGSSVGTLPTVTREGYIFDGWYTSLDFTIPVTENTVPNGYVTYYAKWTGDIKDATFASDSFIFSVGDEDDIVINNSSDFESVTYTSNDTSIVTVDNSGHLTAVDDGETTITVTGSKSGHTRTINVKVTEEITDFVVHFDSMGGSSVDDMFVPINTAIGSFPDDPELADNIFAGWYTNTNYSTKVTTDTVIRSDVTFYAKWIPENAVAEINHTYFTSLQSAFDSEMTGKTTIILLKDISVQNTYLNLYTKNLGKDIVLDLNNKTITGTGSQTLRTKTSLEIKNGTITQSSSNGTIDVGEGGHLIMNSGTIVNSGSRAAIYNEGGIVELGGTVNATSNAQWASNQQRGTVQNKAGTTIITGGTYINTRSSNSYAVSASVGTLTIGTKDDIYNTTNIVLQGETSGIYSAVNYSIYDGMIKGKSSAVNNESKITSIEDNATKVNDTDDGYQTLYYTMPVTKYRIDLDAGDGEVNPTYLLIDDGDQLGTLPTPTRGVYTFDGWFDANDVEADPTHTPTGNETYYAKWHYEVSSEIVEFRTTNNAMKTYYNKIDEWKDSASNFPSWSDSNNSPNWALDATENTAMKNNFDANNCQCADGQCSSSGTVACDKPNGYSTGFNESVSVYLSDENTKAKGAQVSYAKSSNGTIQNLIPNQVYYWELDSDPSVYGYVKFVGERRILDTGDVRNTRDLGGLPVDLDGDNVFDGELKYEKLYRGIKLNSASSVTELANLGITEELDLRESNSDPYKLSDIDGKKYHRIEAQNYYVNYNPDNATEMGYYNMTRAAVKYAMEEIVNDESLYFHCRIGTDRTGTVAYILEGLLGVPEEYRVQDYELSFFYGLIRIHRYHDQKPGSSVGTGHERFVYMHNFMPDNDDIYDWYMAGTTNQQEDEDLINAFRAAMINSY